jgi:hypothetical protein
VVVGDGAADVEGAVDVVLVVLVGGRVVDGVVPDGRMIVVAVVLVAIVVVVAGRPGRVVVVGRPGREVVGDGNVVRVGGVVVAPSIEVVVVASIEVVVVDGAGPWPQRLV